MSWSTPVIDPADYPEPWTYVKLRDGRIGILCAKGIFNRVRRGWTWDEHDRFEMITWNLEGRWRWDGQDHPLDIVEGFPQ